MSVIDILFRVDEICKNYDKYDVDRLRELNAGDDAFTRLYDTIESEIDTVVRKSEVAAMETNRAKVVAFNAEIRRTKAKLMEDVTKLQKLAYKKVKGISKDDMLARGDLAVALGERIPLIPDGSNNVNNKGKATSSNSSNIKFDIQGDAHLDDGFFQETEESSNFRQEYEMRKLRQDEGLDIISDGLETLKNLAHDMNEELDRQVPLIDEIDTKVDEARSDIRNTNVRLKQTLHQVRSSRNFCIDIILLCIILGIAAYLYKWLRCFCRQLVYFTNILHVLK